MPFRPYRFFIAATLSTGIALPAYAAQPLAQLEGDIPQDLRDLVLKVMGEVDEPPRSLAQARRRASKASESAMSVMRSQGYYGADIDAKVIEAAALSETADRAAPRPIITITTGPQFKFGSVSVNYADAPPDNADQVNLELDFQAEQPAIAAKVIAAELRVTNYLNANGFPEAVANARKAVVDHDTKTLSVTYNISAGTRTQFGAIQQTGTAYLVKSWPKLVAPFKPGDDFDIAKLNTLSARVIGTGVFDGATATLSNEAIDNGDGSVTRDVILNVEQGAINTVSGEIGVSTTDGSGIDLTYQRRNFIGYAQTLTLSSTVKTNQVSVGADYNIPFLFRVDRELDFGAEAAQEDTDAFIGDRVSANALLTQKMSRQFKIGLGLGAEASRYEQNGADITAYLFEGLGRASYDTRNSLFDPERGYQAEASIVPTYNFGDESGFYSTASVSGSTYKRVSDEIVLAARAKVGTIVGGDLETIPLNRRFYSGGGGSIRGFGYQTISPVDSDQTPIGGRSVTELGGEVRYRSEGGKLGYVAFVDGGSATNATTPGFDEARIGAGIGIRYFTSFAPLRADIAIPLNKRDSDDPFQIYMSIGQAF